MRFDVLSTVFFALLAFLFVTIIAKGQSSPRTPLENHRVLLIGDSQVAGAFGNALMYELTAHGATYYARVGESGWGIHNWLQRKFEIKRLIDQHKPSLLLIALGGNDYQRVERPDYIIEVRYFWNYVNKIMKKTNKDIEWRVIWISPASAVKPSERIQVGRDRVADTIHEVVTKRNYVESRDITGHFGRTGDGIHFTFAGGQDWARQVMPRIKNCLRQ